VPRLRPFALAAALATALFFLPTPRSTPASGQCGSSGYAYAGLGSSSRAYGVATHLRAVATPEVRSGHVAGWVGVGGPGSGPNGTDEWIQVGFSAFPGSSASSLYYEVARPNATPLYHEIAAGLPVGTTRKVAVLELAGRRGWWRVLVDDHAVGEPVFLPDSHGAWKPLATTETWGAGSFVCNRFSYRFGSVAVATRPGGGWQRLSRHFTFQDHGYRVRRLTAATFLAGTF
jgi:hypothetical protein